jgi:putative transposase
VAISPRLPRSGYLGSRIKKFRLTPTGLRPLSRRVENWARVGFSGVEHQLMPQSLASVFIHLVFSTKERRPFFRDKVAREALHAYIGGISKRLDCPPLIIGGFEDHVHALARFGRTITIADWVKELKRVSNLWLREQSREYARFEWQGGYAAFSVSPSNLESVKEYIARQEEHHRKMSFQDELRALLRKHKVEWDEHHLWD